MDIQPTFGLPELLAPIVDDTANALCERHGEPPDRQLVRAGAAAQAILAFLPGDVIEAMLAGHCVIFHELMVDSVRGTLRGGLEATRRATRSGIVAMDKAFGNNLTRLEHYRTRQAEGSREAEPEDIRTETEIADRVRRHQSRAPEPRTQPASGPARPSTSEAGGNPSPETPETMAAVDPARFALANDQPDDQSLTAAAQLAGLNRQARREIGRLARRLATAAAPAAPMARSPGVTPIRSAPATTASATSAS